LITREKLRPRARDCARVSELWRSSRKSFCQRATRSGATAPLAELSKLYRTAFESALHIPAAEAELAV